MRIDLVFPVLPPTLDGIGDHTARLAAALSRHDCTVRILTAQKSWTAIPGVKVESVFGIAPRRNVSALRASVAADPPDLLVLQFEQFSYGRWGLNPFLPWTLKKIRRLLPRTRVGLMAHEDYIVPSDVRTAIMSVWQRAQLLALGRLSDLILFSIEQWVSTYRSWFPDTPVQHLPVGSNIPLCPMNRGEMRRTYGIGTDDFVVGLFGSMHPSRQFTPVRRALRRLREHISSTRILYIGKHGDKVRARIGGDIPFQDAGPLPAADVSRCFSIMDLYLVPFRNGTSTRRGSFLTALQHGVPTVSTLGDETDRVLRNENDRGCVLIPWKDVEGFAEAAVQLASDDGRRREMGERARDVYRLHFDWDQLADQFLQYAADLGVYRSSLVHDDGAPRAPLVSPN
jgi:glycosyltransferase involved in cell wall biosynthesis